MSLQARIRKLHLVHMGHKLSHMTRYLHIAQFVSPPIPIHQLCTQTAAILVTFCNTSLTLVFHRYQPVWESFSFYAYDALLGVDRRLAPRWA